MVFCLKCGVALKFLEISCTLTWIDLFCKLLAFLKVSALQNQVNNFKQRL
jgi:hypothetical protein